MTTTADAGTELKLCWAYQSSGLAFDNCRFSDWHIHEVWVLYLLGAMARDYRQVTVQSGLQGADNGPLAARL